jgi:acetone carboxylase gamma subunit
MRLFVYLSLAFALMACSKSKSPEKSAELLCRCGKQFAEAQAQHKVNADRVPRSVLEQLEKEMNQCLGPDPMQGLEEVDKLNFKKTFVQHLFKACPDVARNLDFKAE